MTDVMSSHYPILTWSPHVYSSMIETGGGAGAAASYEILPPSSYSDEIDSNLASLVHYPSREYIENRSNEVNPSGLPEWSVSVLEVAITLPSLNLLTYTPNSQHIDAGLSCIEGKPIGTVHVFFNKRNSIYIMYISSDGDLWVIGYRNGYFNSSYKEKTGVAVVIGL